LDLEGRELTDAAGAASSASYRAFGDGVTLRTAPFEQETELTGPVAAKLWISSSTTDADLFLVVHLFDPDGNEVLYHGASDPKQPLTQGWLRASQRELDASRTLPWQPFHPHTSAEPLVPGEVYEVDVEVWPTCIVVPPGYRLGLSVLGRDYDHGQGGVMSHLGIELHGCGVNVHDDPVTRPPAIFDNEVTIYGGGDRASYLLLPVIPPGE
jgi:predicted acyl esterase